MTRLMTASLRTGLLLAAALLAVLAVSCSGGSNKEGAKLAPNQTFRVRIAEDPSTLDPQLASVSQEISVVKQLYRGLFAYDKNLNVIPAVAAEVPTKENGGISGDALTYTVKLRGDATWSDGKPVTAGDFVYAFQRLFDPNAGAQGYYYGFYTAIEGADAASKGEGSPEQIGVSAPDDRTLVIKLAKPQPTLPTLLALWPASPLRKDVIDRAKDAWTEPGTLVTDGPFVLKDYAKGDSITLEANPTYWGNDKPTLQTLVYKIIPDDSAAVIAYENGEIDVTEIPGTDSARFANDSERVAFGQLETYALQYNTKEAPFDNRLVRQAFSRAIDRDSYVTAVLHGAGKSTLGWLPRGMPGADATAGSALGFDAAGAKALLSQAGYTDGKGFPSVTLTIGNDEQDELTAQFLQAQLKQNLGIDVKIESLEGKTFQDRYFNGDFKLTWASWFADYADPENWLPQQFATDGGFNIFGYSNASVDALFEQAASELDQSKRLALYDQAQKIIIDEDQAITPIYNPVREYLLKANIGGMTVTALDAEPGDWFVENVRVLTGAAPPASRPGGK